MTASTPGWWFPLALVMDAHRDSIRASGDQYAKELRWAGVPVDYRVIENSMHGFLNKHHSRAFRDGIETMTTWLDAHDSRIPA